MSDTTKHQTGRTTRMLQEAIRMAEQGHRVYVVFNDLQVCEHIKRTRMRELLGHEGRSIGISFESPETLRNLDWQRMRLGRAHSNCVLLVDHFVIERRFQAMLEMWQRWDADPADQEADTIPSELDLLKEILNVCPETQEPQGVLNVSSDEEGNIVLETRGETTAWKHTIITEEIELRDTP